MYQLNLYEISFIINEEHRESSYILATCFEWALNHLRWSEIKDVTHVACRVISPNIHQQTLPVLNNHTSITTEIDEIPQIARLLKRKDSVRR